MAPGDAELLGSGRQPAVWAEASAEGGGAEAPAGGRSGYGGGGRSVESHSTGAAGRTLIIGMGNPIVSDDAVGVLLATDLKRSLAAVGVAGAASTATAGELGGPPAAGHARGHGRATEAVDVVEECACGGLSLLDMVVGYDRLIVLDAIKTRGGVPGTWFELTAGDLRETLHLRNVHDVNLATALALGRRLGLQVPEDAQVHIFAVEVEDVCTFAETMTPALQATYPQLADEIYRRVTVLLRSGSGAVV